MESDQGDDEMCDGGDAEGCGGGHWAGGSDSDSDAVEREVNVPWLFDDRRLTRTRSAADNRKAFCALSKVNPSTDAAPTGTLRAAPKADRLVPVLTTKGWDPWPEGAHHWCWWCCHCGDIYRFDNGRHGDLRRYGWRWWCRWCRRKR